VKIAWLGHSAFRLDMNGACVLLEPSADAFVEAMGEDGGKVRVIDPGRSSEV
jgi:hypothetical protein